MTWEVHNADCLDVLSGMEDCSVHSIVTDPPYALRTFSPREVVAMLTAWLAGKEHVPHGSAGFMSAEWDKSIPGPEVWRECLRVLKPGAYALVFCAPRTAHLMTVALHLAGFEIRPSIYWHFGSGMPKSVNISKAIDRADGKLSEREVVHRYSANGNAANCGGRTVGADCEPAGSKIELTVERGATEKSREWDGWGTGVKPGTEVIIVARKPLEGSLVDNVLRHGCGGLNIDACRVPTSWQEPDRPASWAASAGHSAKPDAEKIAAPPGYGIKCHPGGRWPADTIFTHSAACRVVGVREQPGDTRGQCSGSRSGFGDVGADSGSAEPNSRVYGAAQVATWACAEDCPVRELERQSGVTRNGGQNMTSRRTSGAIYGKQSGMCRTFRAGEAGTAARFFTQTTWGETYVYSAKASTAEREAGCEELPAGNITGRQDGKPGKQSGRAGAGRTSERRNTHATVKPIDVMRWCVRLVTPRNGTCMDPFTGSGSTGIACVLEGFDFIGAELYARYTAIARARIAHWEPAQCEDDGQLALWE